MCSLHRLDVYTALLNNTHIIIRTEMHVHVSCVDRPVLGPESAKHSSAENGTGGSGLSSSSGLQRTAVWLQKNTLLCIQGISW